MVAYSFIENCHFSILGTGLPACGHCQTVLAFRLQPVTPVTQLLFPHLDPLWNKTCLFVEIGTPASSQPQNNENLSVNTVYSYENKSDAIS